MNKLRRNSKSTVKGTERYYYEMVFHHSLCHFHQCIDSTALSNSSKYLRELMHMCLELVLLSLKLRLSVRVRLHTHTHTCLQTCHTICNDKPYNLWSPFVKKIIIIYVISIRKQCLMSHQCGDKMNHITAPRKFPMKNRTAVSSHLDSLRQIKHLIDLSIPIEMDVTKNILFGV